VPQPARRQSPVPGHIGWRGRLWLLPKPVSVCKGSSWSDRVCKGR